MKTIFDLVTSSNITEYWINKNFNTYTVGEQLFPNKKELGIKLEWIKGATGQPKALRLSAYDSKAIRRDRQGLEKFDTEMPFFKESMYVDEKMRQDVNTLLQTNNEALIARIIAKIFDDQIKLITASYETLERMRMELLTTGAITLSSNGQSYSYDYGVPADQKYEVDVAWSDPDADIIKDINDAKKKIRKKGYTLKRAMCNSNLLDALANNKSIKNRIYVMANGNVDITSSQVKTFIETETGISIYVNDEGYIADNGEFKTHFDNATFVLFPEGELGNTHFGVTPEESDLMGGVSQAEVSLVDNSIAVTTSKIVDPVNVEMKVSMVALPSFEMADSIIILDTKVQ